MHQFSVYTFIGFEKWTLLYNHCPGKNIEHFCPLKKSFMLVCNQSPNPSPPLALCLSNLVLTVLEFHIKRIILLCLTFFT